MEDNEVRAERLKQSLRRMFYIPMAMLCTVPIGFLMFIFWFMWKWLQPSPH